MGCIEYGKDHFFHAGRDNTDNSRWGWYSKPTVDWINKCITTEVYSREFLIRFFGRRTGYRFEQKNTLHLWITSPSGESVIDFGNAELDVIEKKGALPDEYSGFTLCIDVRNMIIMAEGCYYLNAEINGEHLEKMEIPVFRGD